MINYFLQEILKQIHFEKLTIFFINPKIDPFLVARRVIGRKCRTLALVFICLRREDICTGKTVLEALTFASTNPQYDKRLYIDLQVQYMKITSSEHVVYINCSECQNKKKLCKKHVLSL